MNNKNSNLNPRQKNNLNSNYNFLITIQTIFELEIKTIIRKNTKLKNREINTFIN
jgi:hypothetical protein